MAEDGCLNFFAGPVDSNLSAKVNFLSNSLFQNAYGWIYRQYPERSCLCAAVNRTGKIAASSYGNTYWRSGKCSRGYFKSSENSRRKKTNYTQTDLPLTAIQDFRELGKENELFRKLADACDVHQGCWNGEAEKILLEYYHVNVTY